MSFLDRLFNRRKGSTLSAEDVALKIVFKDKEIRDVSYKELVLSNNMAMKALVNLLLKKGTFEPQEYMDMLKRMQQDGDASTIDPISGSGTNGKHD